MFSRMITCVTDLNCWPYLFYGICHPMFTMKIGLCCIPASSKLSSSVLQAFYVLSVLCKLCCCHMGLGLGILLSIHVHQQNAENHAMKNFAYILCSLAVIVIQSTFSLKYSALVNLYLYILDAAWDRNPHRFLGVSFKHNLCTQLSPLSQLSAVKVEQISVEIKVKGSTS